MASKIDHLHVCPSQFIFERTILFMGLGSLGNESFMKLLQFFLPRIEYILFVAVFWGIIANGPRILNFDGDLPRHILTGNLILQTHHVSTTDLFSFRTTGFPSFPHEWLAQVIFAALYDWLGLDGIVLLTATIIVLTWGIVYRRAMQKSK